MCPLCSRTARPSSRLVVGASELVLAADEYYRVVSEREPDKIAWYQVLNMPRVDLRLLYGHSLGCARRIKTRSCRIFPGNFPGSNATMWCSA